MRNANRARRPSASKRNIQNNKARRNALLAAAAACGASSLFLGIGSADGQTVTWSGASVSDSNWSDGTNWVGSAAPVGADTLVFDGSTSLRQTNIDDIAANTLFTLTFGANAGTYTLNGINAIEDNAGFTDNSLNTETLNLPLNWANQHSFTVVAGGTGLISGLFTGSAQLQKLGYGTLSFNASTSNTNTGTLLVSAGTMNLDFSNMASPTNLMGVATLNLGGGTMNVLGNASNPASQTFTSTAISLGQSVLNVANSANTSTTVNLGTLTASAGAAVVFNGPAYDNGASSGSTQGGNQVGPTGTINTSSTGSPLTLTNACYATVNLYDWAIVNGGQIYGASQLNGFYTEVNSGTLGQAANVDVTGNTSQISGTANITSVRLNANAALTVGAGGGNTSTLLGLGGILETPNVGANNDVFSGEIDPNRGSSSDTSLEVWQNNTLGILQYTGVYQNGKATAATWVQNGPGAVSTAAAQTYTGATYLNGGFTYVTTTAAGDAAFGAPATAASLNINGGTVVAGVTFAMDNGGINPRPVAVGLNGAGFAAVDTFTLTIDGAVTGTGATDSVTIGIPSLASNNFTIGNLPGTGLGTGGATTANPTATTTNGTVILSNTGNTYAGGTIVDSGILQINNSSLNVLGSGGITLNGGTFQWASGITTDISARTVTIAAPVTFDTQSNSVTLANSIGNNGAGGITKIGAGTLTLSSGSSFSGAVTVNNGSLTLGGSNIYTGATNINAGVFALNSGATLSNTAITVASGAKFLAKTGAANMNIGSGSTAAAASLNLNGGTFSMVDGSVGTLTLNPTSTFSGTALTIGGTGGTAPLDFEVSSTGADEIVVAHGTTSEVSGGGEVFLTGVGTTTLAGSGTFTLISDPSGGLSPGSITLGTGSVNIGGTFYNATLNNTSTTETVTLSPLVANLNFYWKGATSTWATISNFATDHTGATPQSGSLGGASNVFETADSAANFTQTLDGTYTINSLSFTGTGTGAGTNSVTIGTGSGGPLTINATYLFKDANNNSYQAGTGLVVQSGSAAHTISANIVLGASQSWETDNATANALNVTGNISDSGSGFALTKTDSGALILSGNNSYGGGTVVSGGTLKLGSATGLPSNGVVLPEAGTVDLAGFSPSVVGLSDGGITSGTLTTSTGSSTLTITNSAAPVSYGGTISGALSLAMSGSSTQTLAGTSTYTGGTVVNSGQLIAASNLALGSSTSATGGLSMDPSAGTATVSFTSAAPSIASLTNSGGGTSSIVLGNTSGAASSTTLTVGGGNTSTTFSGIISDNFLANAAAIGNLALAGTSSLTLTGTNTFYGTTTVGSASTLVIASTPALENSTVNLQSGGGTIQFASTITTATFGGLSGTGSLALVNTAGTPAAVALSVGNNFTGTDTFAGQLTGIGSLTKVGNGDLQLTGSNNYTGTTNDSTGTIEVTTGGSITGGTLQGAGWLVDGGAITSTGNSTLAASATAFTESSGTVSISGTFACSASADGTLFKITGGNFTAATINLGRTNNNAAGSVAAPTAAPTTTGLYVDGSTAVVSAGSIEIGSSNSSASVRLDVGTINVSNEILVGTQTATTGRWDILQVNGGTLTAADAGNGIIIAQNGGTNPNDGDFYISGGTAFTPKVAFGAAADTVGGNGSLCIGSSTAGTGILYVGAGGISKPNTTGLTSTVALSDGTLAAYEPWISSLPMTLGTSFTIQTADSSGNPQSISLSGALSGGALIKTGAGSLILTAGESYTGLTTISAGTLQLGDGTNDGSISTTSSVTDNSSLVYDLTNSGSNPSYVISGTGSATLLGSQILTFSTTNTYSGSTTVNGGSLDITGALPDSGTITVGTASLTVDASTALLPTVAITNNGTADFSSISGTNTVGTIDGTGTLTAAGTSLTATHIRQSSLTIASGSIVTIADSAGPGTTTATSILTDLTNSGTLDLKNNDLIITDTTQFSAVQSAITNAYHGGAWNQPGITSSSAAVHPNAYGLGYATAGAVHLSTFDGQTVSSGTVLVKYTLLGDALLTGTVGLGDYNAVVANLNTGTLWSQGAFHPGSNTGLADYNAVIANFNATASGSVAIKPAIKTAALSFTPSAATDLKLEVNTVTGDVYALATATTALTGYDIFDKSGNLLDSGDPNTDLNERLLSQPSSTTLGNQTTFRNGTNYKLWATILDNGSTLAEGQNNGKLKQGTASTYDTINVPANGTIDFGDIYNTVVKNNDITFAFSEADPTNAGNPVTGSTYNGEVDYVGNTVMPEPGTLGLLGLGGIMMMRRRRRAAKT